MKQWLEDNIIDLLLERKYEIVHGVTNLYAYSKIIWKLRHYSTSSGFELLSFFLKQQYVYYNKHTNIVNGKKYIVEIECLFNTIDDYLASFGELKLVPMTKKDIAYHKKALKKYDEVLNKEGWPEENKHIGDFMHSHHLKALETGYHNDLNTKLTEDLEKAIYKILSKWTTWSY